MADDWLDAYVELRQGERATRAADSRMAQRAEDGATRLFRALGERVRSYVERYQTIAGVKHLRFDWKSSRGFGVSRSQYPAVALAVALKGATIQYQHSVRRDDTASARTNEGCFRIQSDLAGNVQARQGDAVFVDVSEISAVLLTPVFDALP